jgi:GNAT superfamily N-acetyltransferase
MAPVNLDAQVAAGTSRLGLSDAGELLTLQLAAWVREGLDNDTLDIPALKEQLPDVVEQLADESLTIWGYRDDRGRLIATVRSSLTDGDGAWIGRLGVAPDKFRQGLGGAMLRLAESRLPASVRHVGLVTGLRSFGNHAFYARYGYAIVEQDPAAGIVRFEKERA